MPGRSHHILLLLALLLLAMSGVGQAAAQVAPPAGGRTPQRYVFIGGTGNNLFALADPAVARALHANGHIGLYQHAVGIGRLSPAQRSALWAAWGLDEHGRGDTVGEVGGGPSPGFLQASGGVAPARVNANDLAVETGNTYTAKAGDARPGTRYVNYVSSGDLARVKADIDFYRSKGATGVAMVMSPNGPNRDLDDRFESGSYWANVRAIALHGGGIGIDAPPSYFFAREEAYRRMVAQMVVWAKAHSLRASFIVSPFAQQPDRAGHSGPSGYDPSFVESTRRLVAYLRERNALPTEWVVENYAVDGTENDVAADGTSNSLNEVALLLAH